VIGGQFDRWTSLYAAQPLISAGLLKPPRGIPILMYHSVSVSHESRTLPYYRMTTSPKRFYEQMQLLRDRHFEVIHLSEALRRLRDGIATNERSVVLTFDDGFDDFRTNAWPILAQFNFKATMFLPTAFVGSSRRSFKGRDCLTWQDVRALHRSGASFGAHTVNHPVLYGMTWAAIKRELRDSRQLIEQELQAAVDSLAYPYAFPQEDRSFVDRFGREAAEAGYRIVVTTAVGRAKRNSNPLALKRLPISDFDDEWLFGSKLAGAYDWIGRLQLLVRRSKKILTWISR
jgi:peptidoglycan/xylan/chitin deacetylase (PgdA/CDA1 family)